MIVAIIIISLAFGWLLKESRFLTIRLPYGGIPSKSEGLSAADDSKARNPWLDKAVICRQCRDECHYRNKERFLCYTLPARTFHINGNTLNFVDGCNYRRARMLRDIIKVQKTKSKPVTPTYKNGYGLIHHLGEIDIYIDGIHKANINGDYKRGMIKQLMKV